MKTIFHGAAQRGHANHGWLQANHSFSFGGYFDPGKIQFGLLRVLNDDTVAAGMGFSEHPHYNMEIVTIPLKGALAHKDSTGRKETIRAGEVQIMSAGTGIVHAEMNASPTESVSLFQIWILPEKVNIEPRYDQRLFDWKQKKNSWTEVVAPDMEQALWINQQAWLSLATLDEGNALEYRGHKPENGFYLMVIEGEVTLGNQVLGKRDAIGISETDVFEMKSTKYSELLLIEVPMA